MKKMLARDEFYKPVQLEPYMLVKLESRGKLRNAYFCLPSKSAPFRTVPHFLQEKNTTEHKVCLQQINDQYCMIEKEEFDRLIMF